MRKGLMCCAALAMAAAMVAGGADAQTAAAQNWPVKPLRIIVPYPPGGLSDVFARLIGDKLARVLGQSVVIDNRGWRQHHHRHPGDRASGARRLHAAAHQRRAQHQPESRLQPAL
jgi:hypothetical protein